jgi:hypothetical protein
MLRKALSRNNFHLMWALIPVKTTAEGFTLHLENLSNCQVSSNPKHPKNLFPNFVTALFLFFSFPLWVLRKFSQTVSDVRRLAGFQARKKWSARRLMQDSKNLPKELEASNLEEISPIVGSFFFATFAPFDSIEILKSDYDSSNPLGFRRGPVYHAKLKIALFFETYIMPAFPDK